MGLFSSIQKLALAPSVFAGNVISNIVKPGSGKTTTAELQKTTAGKILGTAIAGTAAAAAIAYAPVGTGAKLGQAAKTLIPTTLKGKIIGAASLPVIYGVLSKNPAAPIQAASNLAEFGSDIGTFSADPSLQSGKDILTGSPIIAATAAALGIGALGRAALPAAANIIGRQQQTEALIDAIESQPRSLPAVIPQEVTTVGELNPVAPTIEPQGVLTKKPSRKRRSKPLQQTISQRVSVNVSQKQSAHRVSNKYLNVVA